jgi:hypothetical protein
MKVRIRLLLGTTSLALTALGCPGGRDTAARDSIHTTQDSIHTMRDSMHTMRDSMHTTSRVNDSMHTTVKKKDSLRIQKK